MQRAILALCNETAWDDWYPLKGCWGGTTLPRCPGLYRIRLVDGEQIQMMYIGQSGNLKERLSATKNIFSSQEMPYRAPHTAAPALWAWRRTLPTSLYEVSVAPFPQVPGVLRLGLECLALALYRQQYSMSPLVNFGRFPVGWSPSSGNDADLVTGGKRFRGGPTTTMLECHLPGIGPAGPLTGNPHAKEWSGYTWTPWVPMNHIRPVENEKGLYRLRVPDCDPLMLVGSGKLADRLKGYRQYKHLECSWVSDSWEPHQRLELVSDLIAAHLFVTGTIPLWQFEPPDGLDRDPLQKAS
jgi:hypothetical protein